MRVRVSRPVAGAADREALRGELSNYTRVVAGVLVTGGAVALGSVVRSSFPAWSLWAAGAALLVSLTAFVLPRGGPSRTRRRLIWGGLALATVSLVLGGVLKTAPDRGSKVFVALPTYQERVISGHVDMIRDSNVWADPPYVVPNSDNLIRDSWDLFEPFSTVEFDDPARFPFGVSEVLHDPTRAEAKVIRLVGVLADAQVLNHIPPLGAHWVLQIEPTAEGREVIYVSMVTGLPAVMAPTSCDDYIEVVGVLVAHGVTRRLDGGMNVGGYIAATSNFTCRTSAEVADLEVQRSGPSRP